MKQMYVVGIIVKPGIFKHRFLKPLCVTKNEEFAQKMVNISQRLFDTGNKKLNWCKSCYWEVPFGDWKVEEPEE